MAFAPIACALACPFLVAWFQRVRGNEIGQGIEGGALLARIRSIHPGVFTDEAWASVDICARWLAQGILTEADDNGVFEWKPLQLKMRIFPADAVNVTDLLSQLEAAGIVRPFAIDGKPYGAVRNFCKYQRPRKPKAWFPITDEIRAFVALGADGVPQKSEPDTLEVPPVPQKAEKSPQREDGGGSSRRENVRPIPTPELKEEDAFVAYSQPEIDRLQIKFESEDVRTALPELWEWACRKSQNRSERKRLVHGAFESRRGASALIEAKATSPPIQTTPQLAANRLAQATLRPRMAR